MTRRPAKICSECGLRPVHARGLCNSCYQRALRAGTITVKSEPPRASIYVTMLFCPVDDALGVPMYPAPCRFSRDGFRETLAAGFWPDGCIFNFELEYRGKATRWRVVGRYLLEVDSERVAVASFGSSKHAHVELIEAASASRGMWDD